MQPQAVAVFSLPAWLTPARVEPPASLARCHVISRAYGSCVNRARSHEQHFVNRSHRVSTRGAAQRAEIEPEPRSWSPCAHSLVDTGGLALSVPSQKPFVIQRFYACQPSRAPRNASRPDTWSGLFWLPMRGAERIVLSAEGEAIQIRLWQRTRGIPGGSVRGSPEITSDHDEWAPIRREHVLCSSAFWPPVARTSVTIAAVRYCPLESAPGAMAPSLGPWGNRSARASWGRRGSMALGMVYHGSISQLGANLFRQS